MQANTFSKQNFEDGKILLLHKEIGWTSFDVVKKEAKNISVFNVIDPVIKEVVKVCADYDIGVIGTKATIKSNVYERKIIKLCNSSKVSSLATPLLAPMIEEGFINEDISHTVIANYLSNKKLADIDHLILACTHYPLIHQEIKDYYNGKVTVIDSANIYKGHYHILCGTLNSNENYEQKNLLIESLVKRIKKK